MRGSLLFYTAQPCIHGHISPRYTSSGGCVQCHIDADKRRRARAKKIKLITIPTPPPPIPILPLVERAPPPRGWWQRIIDRVLGRTERLH